MRGQIKLQGMWLLNKAHFCASLLWTSHEKQEYVNRIVDVETETASLIQRQKGGPRHAVTPLKRSQEISPRSPFSVFSSNLCALGWLHCATASLDSVQQLTLSGCWLHYLQVWIFHDDIREGTLCLNKLWHSLISPQKQASEGSSVAPQKLHWGL